jgi:hypothetical protein
VVPSDTLGETSMIKIGIGGITKPLEATNKFLPIDSFIVSLDFMMGEAPYMGIRSIHCKYIIISKNIV